MADGTWNVPATVGGEGADGTWNVPATFLALAEDTGDFVDVLVAEFLAFTSKTLAHLLPKATGVDQLHDPFAVGRFSVADDPDVGADSSVIEHVGRETDDGFH